MEINADQVKELREKTGAGMMDCKRALKETNGDIPKAIDRLREIGLVAAAKRVSRKTKEGCIASYIHAGGRIGVLLEVNCETDFVARSQPFQDFVKDIAMQVAASNPMYIRREDVPEDVVEKEKEIYRRQAIEAGKPEKILDKIATGKLKRFFSEVCLMEQTFIKDSNFSVEDYVKSVMAKIGENIVVKRFTRYQLGEDV